MGEESGHSQKTFLVAGKIEQRSKVRSTRKSRVCEGGWMRLETWVGPPLKRARDL